MIKRINDRSQLDVPIKKFMNDVDYFIENHEFGASKIAIDKFISTFVAEYAREESSKEIPIWLSSIAMDEMQKSLTEIFKCLVDVGRTRKDGLCALRKCELLWDTKCENLYASIDFDTKNFILGDELNDFDNEFETESIQIDLPELTQTENINI